jgi:hypothetical protein
VESGGGRSATWNTADAGDLVVDPCDGRTGRTRSATESDASSRAPTPALDDAAVVVVVEEVTRRE